MITIGLETGLPGSNKYRKQKENESASRNSISVARSFLFLFPRFPPKFTVRILERFNGDNSISFRFFLPRGKLEICDCREIIIFSVHPSSHLAQGKRARKKKEIVSFFEIWGSVQSCEDFFHPSKDAAVPPSLDFLSMGGQIRIPTRVPLHILLSGIVRAEERKPKAI